MLAKFTDWIIVKFALGPKRRHQFFSIITILGLLLPFVAVTYFSYIKIDRSLDNLILARRESLAHLAGLTLKEKFDRIIDVGVSLSMRVQFRKFIDAGKWDEAIKIMESVPKDFPYIDTVAIFDPAGTVKAVTPPIPEVIGKNFAYRDYYKGVSRDWQPFVSEVFKRAVEPKYNVVSVAIPIKSESIGKADQKILGILLLTVKLDTTLEWAREIEVGTNGFVYFVDQNGHVAGHPKFSSFSEVVDFSSVPAVQKLLQDEKGVEVLYNPIEKEERISAYEPVPDYGWGVVVQQPTGTAFADKNEDMQLLLILYGLAFAMFSVLVFLLNQILHRLGMNLQREKIFLGSIGDGLIAIDREWNITLFNKAAERISGWSSEEAMGKPLRDFIKFVRERDRSENVEFIEHAIVKGETGFMKNSTVLIRKDGSEVPVGDSASPVFDASGKITGAIIIFRDVSQEKASQQLKSDFAYASHQLRTPVTKALWRTEAIQSSNTLEEAKKNAAVSYSSLQSVAKAMEQILIVSKIDQKIVIPKIALVKLSELFDEVVKSLKSQAGERKIEITTPAISVTAAVDTDKNLLLRVLFEVLENAIKYNFPAGKVAIDMQMQKDSVLIEISDSGIGIPENQQNVIFTKFFRGSNIDTTEIIGAGLGLYVAHEYIKLLGGRIWFTSKVNEGSTFFISLPQK